MREGLLTDTHSIFFHFSSPWPPTAVPIHSTSIARMSTEEQQQDALQGEEHQEQDGPAQQLEQDPQTSDGADGGSAPAVGPVAPGAGAGGRVEDEDDRKLFVGALPQSCPESDIREYFSRFGEIENINLKTDQMTGRSRGFCFVVFKAVSSLEAALAVEQQHEMGGKKLAVKKAQAKQGKVHVGKLPKGTEEEVIREFFSQYGNVVVIEYPFDKMKNEKKNFCFVTFDREDPAKRLLKEGSVFLNGGEVVINKVTPKPDNMMGGGGGRGGGMMMGGGRGGGGGRMGGGGGGGMYGGGGWGAGYQQGGGGWGGGYGDYYSGGFGYGADAYYGGGWGAGGGGGYGGGGWGGGYDAYQASPGGGKAPRGGARGGGGGGGRGGGGGGGGGMMRGGGGQRPKPY